MAVYAFTDANIFYGDTDLTSFANQVSLELTRDALDDTTFGDTYRSRVGGLYDGTFSVSGFQDNATSGDPDDHLFGLVGSQGVLSVCPDGDDEADPGYLLRVREFTYNAGASIGELHGFSVNAQVSDGVGAVRGSILAAKASRTSSGNSTGEQAGTIAAGETGYGALHVFSGTASTLDVKIVSDDNGSFTSATDRITFTQATGATSEWGSVAGAVTDDYWRAEWTIGGGTWSFAVLFGIK